MVFGALVAPSAISSHGDTELRKHDGRLGVVQHVNNYSVAVVVYKEKDVLLVHPQFLEGVDPNCWSEVRAVHQRIAKLQECDLDPVDDADLEVLSRKTIFTARQQQALSAMERFYGLQKVKE